MSTLVLTLLIAAAGDARTIEDPHGFHFTVPAGFEPFPKFQPTANKLYAFGKNLGTPDAITLTLDLVEGPAAAGTPSRSCGALMNSIDRTIGSPLTEKWRDDELSGLRMLMTHVFGEVLVFCVDVPVTPQALSLMVSGKRANEAQLHDTFSAVLASTGSAPAQRDFAVPLGGMLLLLFAVALGSRMLRRARRGK